MSEKCLASGRLRDSGLVREGSEPERPVGGILYTWPTHHVTRKDSVRRRIPSLCYAGFLS